DFAEKNSIGNLKSHEFKFSKPLIPLMKFKTFTYPLFILFCSLWIIDLSAQITIDFSERPEEINVCGDASLSYFTIEMNGISMLDEVQIRMPEGIHYVEGSLIVESGSGLILEESNLSIPNQPVFVPVGEVDPNASVDFSFLKLGKCGAIESSKELAQDTVQVYNGLGLTDTFSSSYNIS